jgi:hypothetical protein
MTNPETIIIVTEPRTRDNIISSLPLQLVQRVIKCYPSECITKTPPMTLLHDA